MTNDDVLLDGGSTNKGWIIVRWCLSGYNNFDDITSLNITDFYQLMSVKEKLMISETVISSGLLYLGKH